MATDPELGKESLGFAFSRRECYTACVKKLITCLLLPALLRISAAATLAEWKFARPGDLQGWRPNAYLADVIITNGALACHGTGSNPILEYRGSLQIQATALQQIEVRLKADQDGTAIVYWSNSTQGKYNGFEPRKNTRFNIVGDGQWHLYRLLPLWQNEGKIIRLRLDLYDGARFALDFLRISALPAAAPVTTPDFDFTGNAQGWQAYGATTLQANSQGLNITCAEADGCALAPPLSIRATAQGIVSLCMAVTHGTRGTLWYGTDQENGPHYFTFPLRADGQTHDYNLDLRAEKMWHGKIVALGLCPSDDAGATTCLRWLKISAVPQGPAQLDITALTLSDALPRAGVPVGVVALIANTGGTVATNVHATLTLPDGVNRLTTTPEPVALAAGETRQLTWQVEATHPINTTATLTLGAENTASISKSLSLSFTPRLALAHTGYVPVPQPVRGPFEIGAYYFPGWNTAERWQPLTPFPERRPLLGWYREGDPEVADWQIKWAVEHGITFFVYDWYWSQGHRQLEHALHDGFFKARYRHLLKFCLLWANHNPPHTSSLADCVAVTRYWIENYFRRPEQLYMAGQPVVIIFAPSRLTEDLGAAGVKPALAAMRAECRAAGLPGLCLIACVGSAGEARVRAAEGYDAVTTYNWAGLGMRGAGNYAPYATLITGYRRQWEQISAQVPVPLLPLPVSGGWDSRPWHGEGQWVRYGRTPELFKRHLQDAKEFLQKSTARGVKMLLVEAWNEWGEGSYIEPHCEFGFGYLDAIRDVFTAAPARHDDVTPADAGLGPYDTALPLDSRTTY